MVKSAPVWLVIGGFLLVVFGSAMLMSCMTTSVPSERAFTKEWSELQQNNAQLERRKEHINRVDQLTIFGAPGEGGVYIGKDEKGEPKLKMGREKETGWKFDLDYSGGPEAEVRYELKWDPPKPGV